MPSPHALPLDLPRAARALRALREDPDDTAHVFAVVESLSGRAPEFMLGLFEASPSGRRLLAERPDIVSLLENREALRAMPKGSLAHAYLEFVERENIDARGLVEASEAGVARPREPGSPFEYVAERMRDTHDLWHALTGYHGDVVGETALLAFIVAQTRNPGILMIVLLGVLHLRRLDALKTIVGGFRRGVKAEYLPPVDWEALLALPLSEVRARLSIESAGDYPIIRSSDLRAQGLLQPRPKATTGPLSASPAPAMQAA